MTSIKTYKKAHHNLLPMFKEHQLILNTKRHKTTYQLKQNRHTFSLFLTQSWYLNASGIQKNKSWCTVLVTNLIFNCSK